jgi:hypothetical protein
VPLSHRWRDGWSGSTNVRPKPCIGGTATFDVKTYADCATRMRRRVTALCGFFAYLEVVSKHRQRRAADRRRGARNEPARAAARTCRRWARARRRSWRLRRRSATRSSTPPASACARCRWRPKACRSDQCSCARARRLPPSQIVPAQGPGFPRGIPRTSPPGCLVWRKEVKVLGSLGSTQRTQAQTYLAYFFADNPILMWGR